MLHRMFSIIAKLGVPSNFFSVKAIVAFSQRFEMKLKEKKRNPLQDLKIAKQ